jgi:hypothetical protein
MANENDQPNGRNTNIYGGQFGANEVHGNQTVNFGSATPNSGQVPNSSSSKPERPEPYKPTLAKLEGKGGLFISYKSEDRPWVEGVVQEFIQRGIVVWWDQMNLTIGSNWRDMIQTGIQESKACLLFVSAKSLASDEVKIEYRAFLSQKKPIYSVMLENVPLPIELAGLQARPYAQVAQVIDIVSQFVR